LNRLTDDQSQPRVRNEADAVETVLRLIREGLANWVSSTILEIEISRNPDLERRRDVAALLELANEVFVPGPAEMDRATLFQTLGFGAFDALHLACAERNGVDVFLTTDDGLLRSTARNSGIIHMRVENPVSWYQEVAL
jgi:predicted nucleic acid-binding protein